MLRMRRRLPERRQAGGAPVGAARGVRGRRPYRHPRPGHPRIVTEHHAGARRAVAVKAMRPDGTSFTVSTGLVVAAAGALHTPALLRRSGLAEHPRLGRNLAIHPAISVAGRFTEAVTGPGAGLNILQSVGVDDGTTRAFSSRRPPHLPA
jgi:hypothetical protein